MWGLIFLSFKIRYAPQQTPVWTYPKVGSPSCYRSHRRSCMERWVNMHWCSAHRLHPWNNRLESVITLPIPFCTNEKKLFWNGKGSSEMRKSTNIKTYTKKFFSYKCLGTCFRRKIPLLFTNVQWWRKVLRYRTEISDAGMPMPEASASMPVLLLCSVDWVQRHTICDERIM